MTTTRFYQSSDSGAPVLTGQSGSFKELLKALLYGNGSGVAYGSGANEKLAAGWSMPFADTPGKVVLRNSLAAGATGYYLRILDDASLAGSGAREASMLAYATMSDIDTGTNPTPTAAQLATGVIVRKSSTADATARAWYCVADELGFWLHVISLPSSTNERGFYGAGDIATEVPGDANGFIIGGRTVVNSAGGAQNWLSPISSFTGTGGTGMYIGRGYAGTGGPLIPTIISFGPSTPSGNTSMLADPAPGSGMRYFTQTYLAGEGMIRGRLRGFYSCLNNLSAIAPGSKISNAVGLPPGSELLAMPIIYSGGASAVPCIETILPW